MQAASLWADKIGDGGSAAEVYERVLQIDPGHQIASIELEQLYRQRKSWMKLVELLLARTEFVARRGGRGSSCSCRSPEIYEQQLGDRDSAFVTLQAAFREDYSNDHVAKELERLATAADKWNELIGEYTQVVQGISRRQAGGRPVGEDRALVRLGAAPRRLRDRLGAAGAAARRHAHRRAAGAGGLLPQAEALGATWSAALARHAECEHGAVPARSRSCWPWPTPTRRQLGDATQAMAAYQRALDADEHCIDAINALERLYRRTQAWDRLVDVLSKKSQVVDDTEQAIRLRLQVGELWEDRLGDNDRAVDAYKEVLSVDPQNLPALKALDALYEKTGRMEEYLENLEHQLEVVAARGGSGRDCTSRWRRSGRRTSPSRTAPPRCWRRSC